MGKKNKNRRSRNYKGKKPRGERKPTEYVENFTETAVENGNFKMEAYYALQGLHNRRFDEEGKLVPCETDEEKNKERLLWRTTIATILPASFRIACDVPDSLKQQIEAELEELIAQLKEEAAKIAEEGEGEKQMMASRKLGFLPHAYQLNIDRKSIRKDPTMEKLHNWLKKQTEAGFITRQETVSMVPPVILAPQPDDSVLDMCAAPGSKTSQILEKLSTKGSIVANDANPQRAYMLVNQLRRIMHNNPACLITACEAQFFPQTLSFDRVLSDVPCSGDGTSRKNILIWKKWNQLGALALHALQADISWKGAAVVKVGGYMCYSTCSLNPVENEAVVAELLRRSKGCLELVDAPLEGFRTRPGLTTWKVLAEIKSNRQIKNEQNKTNTVMQQRRAEWAQKRQQQAAATHETQTVVVTEKELDDDDDGDDIANDDAAMEIETNGVADEEIKGDSNDDDPAQLPMVRLFDAPSSWDDGTLIGLAESAGLKHFKSVEEVPESLSRRVRPSCFPPTEEEVAKFHLEKCVRCMSQDNDTGGFFVALLKKVAPMSRREARQGLTSATGHTENVDAAEETPDAKRIKPNPDTEGEPDAGGDCLVNETEYGDDAESDSGPNQKSNFHVSEDGKKHTDVGRDDFVPVDDALLDPLIDHYGLKESFPREQYMTRACGDAKVLYYLTKSVKENFIDQGIQKRVTIINSGVRGFVRNSDKRCEASHRVCQEGVHFLVPYMSDKRKIVVCMDDFIKCLSGGSKPIPLAEFSDSFAEKVRPLSVGCVVVLLEGYENDFGRKMMITMWRCRGEHANCLVNKAEVEGMNSKISAVKEERLVK